MTKAVFEDVALQPFAPCGNRFTFILPPDHDSQFVHRFTLRLDVSPPAGYTFFAVIVDEDGNELAESLPVTAIGTSLRFEFERPVKVTFGGEVHLYVRDKQGRVGSVDIAVKR